MTRIEDQAWDLTLMLAQHHRLDPNTRNDRCTCGFKTALGRMFTEHIAKLIVRDGWRKP